jgi:DMSO/TMAO reductase YedYZ molybdopterin-dependent catalytic subunit
MMDRRRFLTAAALGGAAIGLSGCKVLDGLTKADHPLRNIMEAANGLTYRTQRLLGGDALAPEFAESDIRQGQKPNGTVNPDDAEYRDFAAGGFADWRLRVTGAVETPQEYSLAELQAMPARTQITRHDCVEGWSCVAKWTGVPLATLLDAARPAREARFVVFHCMDTIERSLSGLVKYYESIDMRDAVHPQTILAYGLNDAALPVANGAPLRVRVERQLGYKMAKYLHTIEVVAGLEGFGDGNGSYWADRGYDWYAGI